MAARERLSEYHAKRDFGKTREPRGKQSRSRRKSLGFFVQKHAARRLHYDLRLEWDGVLLSWAVTKGPSPDPTQKRLAVRTEDHPLSYAQFEGTIPRKEYGGGTVMLWDQGKWRPRDDPDEGLASGKLSFAIDGARMQGGWVLVRMKGRNGGKENWLLIKERDEHSGHDPDELVNAYTTSIATSRTMDQIAKEEAPPARKKTAKKKKRSAGRKRRALPRFHKPQLATLSDRVPEGEDWLHESKFDGYRCIAAVAGDQVRCYSRSGLDWTGKFGRIARALPELDCASALLDGEVVVPGTAAGSQFNALQAALSEGGPLAYYVFDLLELDGADLKDRPLIERKAQLRKLLGTLPRESPIAFSEHVRGSGLKVLDAMCRDGREGIVSKKAVSTYRGIRSSSWLKIKCTRRQEFVIGGFTPSDKRGREFASVLVGTFENGKLLYRGRVGSGFSGTDLAKLSGLFDELGEKEAPFDAVPKAVSRRARWVRPDLVAEIDFTELTDDGHVRHGVFKGLREDKKPARVKLEQPLEGEAALKDEYHGIRISNPHRVIYQKQGITKAELANYYDVVGERMLPHVIDHPLSLLRCPKGSKDECFFQKHASAGFPEDLKRVNLREKSSKRADYLYVDGIKGIIAGVQMGTLEFHIWGSRIDSLEKPDRVVFDLDPDEKLEFPVVALAAAVLRQRLEKIGLQTVALVTGGKGVHVIAPLRRTAEWPQVKAFAQGFATRLAADEPDVFTATMSKSRRKGRIFVDWFRNERGATAIAPYSTRARENGPVATPVSWEELEDLPAANCFRVNDVLRRVEEQDPWESSQGWRQSITAAMTRSVSEQ